MKLDTTKLLNKSLDVMELFLHNQDEMTLSDMAHLTGFNKATVYRIASTLIERGYLSQQEKRGKYSLGAIYLNYSKAVKDRLQPRSIALPYINELTQALGECVDLALVKESGVLFTETFRPPLNQLKYSLQIMPAEDVDRSLHAGSLGKIILAAMSDDDLEKYIRAKGLGRFTANTITDKDILKEELSRIRQEEVAYDNEELSPGVNSLSAGLRDSDGKVIGSLGIVAPAVRLPLTKMLELTPMLKSYTTRISKDLGYRG